MKIFEVSFMKRKNLGNYEHEEVVIKAQVEENEDHVQAIAAVKFACQQALGMVITQTTPAQEEKPAEEKKTTKKKASKKTSTNAKKTTKKTAPAKEGPVETKKAEIIENVTIKEVKDKLIQVWKKKGEAIAKDILKSFGVAKSEELSEDDFLKVIGECEKCLK